MGEHLGAILAVEGQRELGHQQTVGGAEIVAAAFVFQREVLLVPGELLTVVGRLGPVTVTATVPATEKPWSSVSV